MRILSNSGLTFVHPSQVFEILFKAALLGTDFTACSKAAHLNPAAAYMPHVSVCKCCLHTPVSSLSFDSPPPTTTSVSLYLLHGHLTDMEARRLEASSTIIIAVCQACATPPSLVVSLPSCTFRLSP